MPEIFCPVHKEVLTDLREIKSKQDTRHCSAHEARLNSLDSDAIRIDIDNRDQWVAINQLRRLVWIGVGAVTFAGFVGSIIGSLVMNWMRLKP
jgi:hypothetical protein